MELEPAAQMRKISGPWWQPLRPLLEDDDGLLGPGALYKMALTCKPLRVLVHARDGSLWRRFTEAVQNRVQKAGYTPGDLVSVEGSRAVVVQMLPGAPCPPLGTHVARPLCWDVSAEQADGAVSAG